MIIYLVREGYMVHGLFTDRDKVVEWFCTNPNIVDRCIVVTYEANEPNTRQEVTDEILEECKRL